MLDVRRLRNQISLIYNHLRIISGSKL